MVAVSRPDSARVFEWLSQVPDPEIPVISVVDLGIVRNVQWDEDTCVVTITPTYSGCPAMREIVQDIEQTLALRGLTKVRVDTVLSPAWTTDWLSDKGRAALKGFGIAPPSHQAVDISALSLASDTPSVACPLCDSKNTRVLSHFGSTPCKALYRCNHCSETFDYFKPH